MATELPEWQQSDFAAGGISHVVYRKGTGPGVVLMHELPGLTPTCIRLGKWLVDAKYCVFMPLFFGRANEHAIAPVSVARICIQREIWLFSSGRTSPIVDWLRALCRHVKQECGGDGVGVVGMCLSGNFAITLLAEETVLAPVACQPSLPSFRSARALAMSPADLAAVKARAVSANVPLIAFRFQCDWMCRAGKFARLAEELPNHFKPTTLPGNGHSVLTDDFIKGGEPARKALRQVLEFLDTRLHGGLKSGAAPLTGSATGSIPPPKDPADRL